MITTNEVRILGYLGDDPEIYTNQQGSGIRKVVRFNVATTERWINKETGETKERTEWHRIVAFGKSAEVAEKYLGKGALVLIEGKLCTDKWQDDTGADRYSTSIIIQGYKGLILLDKPEIQENSEETGQGHILEDIPFAA